MKIYIKLIRAFLGINFLQLFLLSTLSAKPQDDNLSSIKKNLGIGINLSLYEHFWSTPNFLLEQNVTDKLNNIAEAGFKTVRFPLAFDIFLEPNSSNFQPRFLNKLNEIYTLCAAKKLNLILTYHYGKLNDSNTFSEIDRIAWMWKQIQRQFSGQAYSSLFFELYNEPVMNNLVWKESISTIINYLRYEDKNRIYIVGGTNYNSIAELINFGKIPDDKLFYTFHFYEPFIFTHQGADWTNNKSYITNLPYPYKKNRMPKNSNPEKGSSVEKDLLKYPQEATNNYINNQFKNIYQFCLNNKMPLICTETGVIKLAKKNFRKNYLLDVIRNLVELNIQPLIWDYDDKFSIKKNNTKVENYLHKRLLKNKN